MEPNFQTSFIPKKPMIEKRATSAPSVGFFTVISIFLLFVALLVSGGLYFYKGILAKNLATQETSLNLAKKDFESSKITELQVLDKRLNAATEVLSNHMVVSPIFQVLNDITMKSVRYTKFSYTLDDTKDAKVTVQMSGIALDGYRSIALQADLFTTKDEAKNFINPVFSNLTLDDKGNVLFDLTFSVDPSFVNYKAMVKASS